MTQAEPPAAPLFPRSPLALMLLVLVCAAVLWFKLDSISRNLAQHVHGSPMLNSILLVTPPRRLLIVPRYPGVVPDETEQRALAAYREAYGEDMEIASIDAESLAHANGSLRCIACPVPAD